MDCIGEVFFNWGVGRGWARFSREIWRHRKRCRGAESVLRSSLLSLVQRSAAGKGRKCSEARDPAEMSEGGSQEPEGPLNGDGSPTKRPPRPPVGNQVTVVLGAQWGDEGKGKVVDLLAQDADMVCRCQVG